MKIKKIGAVLAAVSVAAGSLTFVSAADNYKYSDTIGVVAGIEVFQAGAPHWLTGYQGGKSTLHLTHDAYEGSAALLITDVQGGSAPANYELSKAANYGDISKIVEGDNYKIEFYQKPVGTDGVYTLSDRGRYYNNYDIKLFDIYDAETGEKVSASTEITPKWYKTVMNFTATASNIKDWVGLALWSGANPIIIDSVRMYREMDGSWVEMADGSTVRNGLFEEGVTASIGKDPTDVKVENKSKAVTLSWTNPQNQAIKIYNGSELIATTAEGAISYTLTNLEANREYTFTLKGVGTIGESAGVTVSALPFDNLPDTIDTISGIEVFQAGAPHWLTGYQGGKSTLHLTHDAYEGSAALLITDAKGGTAPANYELSKAANYGDISKMVSGDKYKIEFYQKPAAAGDDGLYILSTQARYYNSYDAVKFTTYDAEMGEQVTANTTIAPKWYKSVMEFTATDAQVKDWVGFAPWSGANPIIIDSVRMYREVEGEWTEMADGSTVRNGLFEEGVTADTTAPYDVENLEAIAENASVTLAWDAVEEADLAGYKVFMNGKEIADLARNVVSYKVTGLTNDTEYTFVVKSYDRMGNVAEGSEISATPTVPAYTIGEFVMGESVVAGENTVSINVENAKVDAGVEAQLIIGLYNGSGALVKAAASIAENISIGTNKTLTAKITVDDIDADNYTIKAFCWKSIDSLSSLKEAREIGE